MYNQLCSQNFYNAFYDTSRAISCFKIIHTHARTHTNNTLCYELRIDEQCSLTKALKENYKKIF